MATFAKDGRVISEYLETLNIRPLEVEALLGGTTNQLWRVYINKPAIDQANSQGSKIPPFTWSIVVKHAEPFVMHNPNVPFPVDRMSFEATALVHLQEKLTAFDDGAQVQTPTLYHHDGQRHCLMMSDVGSTTLKAKYTNLNQSEVVEFGVRLGKWLAALHHVSHDWDIGPEGNVTAKSIYRYPYQNLGKALQHWYFSDARSDLADMINERYGSLLETDDDVVCMGDFWPGNIIVGSRSGSRGHQSLAVVDWEMIRRGSGATDFGQFLAEAILLERLGDAGNVKTLALPIYQMYMNEVKNLSGKRPSRRFMNRVHVHCAVHLVFWPSVVDWGSFAASRRVARVGVEALHECLRDPEALSESLMLLIRWGDR